MQLAGADRLGLRLSAQAGVDQAMVKPHRLFRGLQRNGEFRRAGRAEIIGDAADGDDERVRGDAAGGGDLAAFVVMVAPSRTDFAARSRPIISPRPYGSDANGPGPDNELVLGRIDAARRHRVEQRLRWTGAAALDQGDIGKSALPSRSPSWYRARDPPLRRR